MRIGINGLLLTPREGYRQTGISRYVDRLLSSLPAVMTDAELLAYTGREVSLPVGIGRRSPLLPTENPAVRIGWETGVLPVRTRLDRLDLFHGTVNTVPWGLGCRSVVTIHDLALLRWPEQVPANRYRYLSRAIRGAVARANLVLAVSAATKQDVVDLLGVEPDRIDVTPLGVDPAFAPPGESRLATFRTERKIERPFLLTVGTLEPRKNLPRLLEAFSSIKASIPHDLVLVGPEGWKNEEMRSTLERLDLKERIRFTGFVPEAELPCWYAAADLVAIPSLYEGFGLPVIEAMACGGVVLTSDRSALPEVAGNAAILVDPEAVDSIAAGILTALGDDDLRVSLRERGCSRARAFTWRRTAEATAAAYRKALA